MTIESLEARGDPSSHSIREPYSRILAKNEAVTFSRNAHDCTFDWLALHSTVNTLKPGSMYHNTNCPACHEPEG